MKIYVLPMEMVNSLRSWFHPRDRSVILAPATFIEGEEIVTPAHPDAPDPPVHNRGRLYWKDGCWTQLDEDGNEQALCPGAWQTWSPTVSQAGSVVAATINYAIYVVWGDTVHVQARLDVTGAGSAGNAIIIGNQPAAIQPENTGSLDFVIGSGIVRDTGTNIYAGALVAVGAANWQILESRNTSGVGSSPSFALASGDRIGFQATFKR